MKPPEALLLIADVAEHSQQKLDLMISTPVLLRNPKSDQTKELLTPTKPSQSTLHSKLVSSSPTTLVSYVIYG
jgi:hypothetical protein